MPVAPKPLRLWPGVIAVTLQWLAWLVLPLAVPEATMYGFMLGVLGGEAAVLLWWLFLSRAAWSERSGAVLLMVAGVFATSRLVHPSIANGAMGLMLYLYAIPVLSLALVAWAVAVRHLSHRWRRVSLVATILAACGMFTLVRTGGMSGEGGADLHWRWTPTPEERLLAQAPLPPPPARPADSSRTINARWPGFRGPGRDGVVRGSRIATDWSRSAPAELWRRPVGPAWSSFAVGGDYLYTQEQRGEEEAVSCYDLATGQPVWMHQDHARFWESNAGAGPRATPALSGGHVYTLGATGIVNALNAADGTVTWSRNATAETGSKIPNWAFAGSPLVINDCVIVATAGRLAAYDRGTGKPRWTGPTGGGGYSSPHAATLDGVDQILLLRGAGIIGVAPDSGHLLWNYEWRGDGIVQPALTAEGDLLLGSGSGLGAAVGVRRISVTHAPAGWSAQERWSSPGLKPYFNDFVVHRGHAYGFDGGLLACIDLADGQRRWKGGRYGHGQVILLADQDLLLVLSEKGEVALVQASPVQFRELARRPAIHGKTWNHPVVVDDVLLVRNSEEMAAFRLP